MDQVRWQSQILISILTTFKEQWGQNEPDPSGPILSPLRWFSTCLRTPSKPSLWKVSFLFTQENKLWLFFSCLPHLKTLKLQIWPGWIGKVVHWGERIQPSLVFKNWWSVSKNRALKMMCLRMLCGWPPVLWSMSVTSLWMVRSEKQCPWSTGASKSTGTSGMWLRRRPAKCSSVNHRRKRF